MNESFELEAPEQCEYSETAVQTDLELVIYTLYSITCIQRPLNGSNESGLLQQVVFKCKFY